MHAIDGARDRDLQQQRPHACPRGARSQLVVARRGDDSPRTWWDWPRVSAFLSCFNVLPARHGQPTVFATLAEVALAGLRCAKVNFQAGRVLWHVATSGTSNLRTPPLVSLRWCCPHRNSFTDHLATTCLASCITDRVSLRRNFGCPLRTEWPTDCWTPGQGRPWPIPDHSGYPPGCRSPQCHRARAPEIRGHA